MVGPTYYLHPGDLSLIKLVMPRLAPTDPKFHAIPKSQICAYSTAEFQFLSPPRDRGRQPEFCCTSQYPWYSLQSTTGPDKTFQSLTQALETDRDHVSDLARLESLMAGWSWDCPEAMGEPSRPGLRGCAMGPQPTNGQHSWQHSADSWQFEGGFRKSGVIWQEERSLRLQLCKHHHSCCYET